MSLLLAVWFGGALSYMLAYLPEFHLAKEARTPLAGMVVTSLFWPVVALIAAWCWITE